MKETSDSPIDFAELEAIIGDDDPDELFEMLDLFRDLFPPQLAAVETALAARDRPAVRAAAHAAKSAALSAAATPLARIMAAMEKISADAGWNDLDQLARDGAAEFGRIEAMLEARRK